MASGARHIASLWNRAPQCLGEDFYQTPVLGVPRAKHLADCDGFALSSLCVGACRRRRRPCKRLARVGTEFDICRLLPHPAAAIHPGIATHRQIVTAPPTHRLTLPEREIPMLRGAARSRSAKTHGDPEGLQLGAAGRVCGQQPELAAPAANLPDRQGCRSIRYRRDSGCCGAFRCGLDQK